MSCHRFLKRVMEESSVLRPEDRHRDLAARGEALLQHSSLLEDMELFEHYKPDVVLYDVLGDVVCGGFAAPIREGYAEKVLIVTSGEKMALYAANNISSAVRNFEDRSYARVFGIVLNHQKCGK